MDKWIRLCHIVTRNRPQDPSLGILILEKSIRQNTLPYYSKEQQEYFITYLLAHNAMLNRVEGELDTVYTFMEHKSQDSEVG